MSARESAWQAGMDAAEALAPETGLFAQLDPADFGESVLSVLARAAARPAEVAGASLRCGTAVAGAWPAPGRARRPAVTSPAAQQAALP